MSETSAADRADQIQQLEDELLNVGIPKPVTFGYPFGYRNIWTDRDVAAHGHKLARYPGTASFDTRYGTDLFRVAAARFTSDNATGDDGQTRLEDAKAQAKQVLSRPLVFLYSCHLGPTHIYPAGSEPTPDEVTAFIDYVLGLGVPILKYSDIIGNFNLLANPSFEDGMDAWTISTDTGAGTHSVETVTPYTGGGGTQAVQLVAPTSADGSEVAQRVPIIPGQGYHLSARYSLSGGSPASTYLQDTMSPDATDSWGSAGTGGAWTIRAGNATAFDKTSGLGTIVSDTGDLAHRVTSALTGSQRDVDISCAVQYDKVPADNQDLWLIARYTDDSNYTYVRIRFGTSGFVEWSLFDVVATVTTQRGAFTHLTSRDVFTEANPAISTKFWLRVQFDNLTVRAKLWLDTDEQEPDAWEVIFQDSALRTDAGGAGVATVVGASASVPVTFSFYWVGATQVENATSGVRLDCTFLDASGNVVPPYADRDPSQVLGTAWKSFIHYWAQLATDVPIVPPEPAVTAEIHLSLSGRAGTATIDNVVFARAVAQPDGPLG